MAFCTCFCASPTILPWSNTRAAWAVDLVLLIAPSLLNCEGWAAISRRDVVIQSKEVGGVVAIFDRGEPVPGRTRVGIANSPVALRTQKVYVNRAVAAL